MTWKTHKVVTAFLVLAFTKNFLWSLLAAVGSVLPDSLELFFYGKRVPFSRHRTYTHWVLFWGLSCVIFRLLCTGSLSWGSSSELFCIGFWISLGALLHCLQDSLSGKVPFFLPTKKNFGVRLIQTGRFEELVLFVAFSFALLALSLDLLKP